MKDTDQLLYDERECHRILWTEYERSGHDIDTLKALCVLFCLSLKKAKSIVEKINSKENK